MRLSLNRDVHVSILLLSRHGKLIDHNRARSLPVSFASLYLRVSISRLSPRGQKSRWKAGGEVSRNENGERRKKERRRRDEGTAQSIYKTRASMDFI